DQFWRALDVVVIGHARLAARLFVDDEKSVGLWFAVQIEEHGAVVSGFGSRRGGLVISQPADNELVGGSVFFESRGRWHVNDSFDELRFFDVRACLVAAVELRAREVIAGL